MKKLKHQYKQSIQSTRHDYLWKVYPNVRSSIFKKFSTQQERSFYFLHRIEYKSYSLKIRVARGAGLPQVWDDLICAELAGDFHLGYARQLTDKSSLLFDLAF